MIFVAVTRDMRCPINRRITNVAASPRFLDTMEMGVAMRSEGERLNVLQVRTDDHDDAFHIALNSLATLPNPFIPTV